MWSSIMVATLAISLLQIQPASCFGGTSLSKLSRSGSIIPGRRNASAVWPPSGHVDASAPIVKRRAAAHLRGRPSSWVLRGKYDTLEEAIAFARAQAGKGPASASEEGSQISDMDPENDGSEGIDRGDAVLIVSVPEAAGETVVGKTDLSMAKSAVVKPAGGGKTGEASGKANKAGLPEKIKFVDKADGIPRGVDGDTSAAASAPAKETTAAPTQKQSAPSGWSFFGAKPDKPSSSLAVSKPETIVVVAGATERVGQLAVRRILELYDQVLVRAVVSDFSTGIRVLREEQATYGVKLEIVAADLQSLRSAGKAVAGASAVVFCASGFAQNLSFLRRFVNTVRLALNPKSVAEIDGVKYTALALKAAKKVVPRERKAAAGNGGQQEESDDLQPLFPNAPRFVLLSSAAVTRPQWSSEEKALYPLAAEIPIVKLNPFNILNVKAEGEKELREVGIPYAVVRPCGLNDDHPRGRPLFSVGDTAAGRICREDVADVLVRCLATPEATGKTFEVQTLPGLDKVASSAKTKAGIDRALANLPSDKAIGEDPELLGTIRRSTYPVLTQLRPVPLTQTIVEEG
ncbi:unnamed protein product [Ascophyllum nodosum]